MKELVLAWHHPLLQIKAFCGMNISQIKRKTTKKSGVNWQLQLISSSKMCDKEKKVQTFQTCLYDTTAEGNSPNRPLWPAQFAGTNEFLVVWLCDNLYTTDPTLSDLNSAMVCGISRKAPSPIPKSSLYTDSSAVKSSVSNVSSLNVDISTISSLAVQSHKCKSLMNISLCCWRLRHCLIGLINCVSPQKTPRKSPETFLGTQSP